MFQISFVYLVIIICTLDAEFQKKKKKNMPAKLWLVNFFIYHYCL